jgi:uncharacterized membrane protein YtjA (UPF0391 family)
MLRFSIAFFVLAIIAGTLGAGGVAYYSIYIAVGLALVAIVLLVLNWMGPGPGNPPAI